MKEKLKKAGRILLHGVIWVFVLSIRIDNQTLFHHAHSLLVQNQIVAAIEYEGKSLFHRVTASAKDAVRKVSGDKKDQG